MSAVIDPYKKITVSLGGVCELACRHCYTMTKQFRYAAPRTPQQVVQQIHKLSGDFATICISGDTDCFLNPTAGIELIEAIAFNFPSKDLMFTTRLVPPPDLVSEIGRIARTLRENGAHMIPGVSFVAPRTPNFSEMSRRISGVPDRINFLKDLHGMGMPNLLALRPTFPFSLVSQDDVRSIIDAAGPFVAAVLGEVLLLDEAGQLADRLHLPRERTTDRMSRMTFLDQPAIWRKRTLSAEVNFAKSISQNCGIPYFLRSGTAQRYIHDFWQASRPADPDLIRRVSGGDSEPDP